MCHAHLQQNVESGNTFLEKRWDATIAELWLHEDTLLVNTRRGILRLSPSNPQEVAA